MNTQGLCWGLVCLVAGTASASAQGTTTIEAESGRLGAPMVASGGAIHSPTRYRGTAEYTLAIPADGVYAIELRTRHDTGAKLAKLSAKVGGRGRHLKLKDLGGFAWQTDRQARLENLELARGSARLELKTVDEGVHVDAIRLIAVEVNSPAPQPSPPAPQPSPPTQPPAEPAPADQVALLEAESGRLQDPLVALGGAIHTTKSYRGRAEYDLELAQGGTYAVELRTRSESRGTYRLTARLGSRRAQLKFEDAVEGVFGWQTERRARLEVELESGRQTLELSDLQAGVHVDALRLIALELDAPSAPPAEAPGAGSEPPLYAPPPAVTVAGAGREALLNHLTGFASGTTGGYQGATYRVTNLNDAGPGSLRAGAESSAARWIVFDVSGTIALASPLKVGDDTTIDGRGQRITITRHGLKITNRRNVIVHNVAIRDVPDDDAITVYRSERVWIDHVSLEAAGDGLLDITEQSNAVTVSWCRLENHVKTMLIGANNSRVADKQMHITLHHNLFQRTVRRNPAIRFARVHLWNNVFSQWGEGTGGDCVAATYESQVRLEANVFDPTLANRRALRVTVGQYITVPGFVQTSGNLLLGGAELFEREPTRVFDPATLYPYTAEPATTLLQDRVVFGAGRQDVPGW